MVIHLPAKFGDQKHSGSGDIMFKWLRNKIHMLA